MRKANRVSNGPPLSSDDFWAEAPHNALFAKLFEIPGFNGPITIGDLIAGRVAPSRFAIAVHGLKETGFNTLLEAAERKNSPEAFKEILMVLFRSLHVRVPEGVFTPPTGSSGRPSQDLTQKIHSEWIAMGRPPIEKDPLESLAEKFYQAEWSDRRGRKRLCDRVRAAIIRGEVAATKSKAIS